MLGLARLRWYPSILLGLARLGWYPSILLGLARLGWYPSILLGLARLGWYPGILFLCKSASDTGRYLPHVREDVVFVEGEESVEFLMNSRSVAVAQMRKRVA